MKISAETAIETHRAEDLRPTLEHHLAQIDPAILAGYRAQAEAIGLGADQWVNMTEAVLLAQTIIVAFQTRARLAETDDSQSEILEELACKFGTLTGAVRNRLRRWGAPSPASRVGRKSWEVGPEKRDTYTAIMAEFAKEDAWLTAVRGPSW